MSIKRDIKKALTEKEIIVNKILITGHNKETNEINRITISVDDVDLGFNVASVIRDVIGEVEEKYGVCFKCRLLDF